MSSRKSGPGKSSRKSGQDELDAGSSSPQHQLVTKLRAILADPSQHTVGALAAAVHGGLAELSLLKDRLDLISPKDDEDTFKEPSSGATAAPGVSKRA